MGIEPTSKAWEALILPMNYARLLQQAHYTFAIVVEHFHCEECDLF